jgi:pSer/pThr/pTyr-binding forkhead associated (FHA) protein
MFRVRSKVASADDLLPRRPVAADDAAGAPRIVLRTEQGERVVPLQAQVTVLGRGTEADVRLSDTGVSRVHAELRREGDAVTLADRGSTNGTSVNGRRVSTTVLRDGDVVEMGATTLVFRAPETEG